MTRHHSYMHYKTGEVLADQKGYTKHANTVYEHLILQQKTSRARIQLTSDSA